MISDYEDATDDGIADIVSPPDGVKVQLYQEDLNTRTYHARLKLMSEYGQQTILRNGEQWAEFDLGGVTEIALAIPGVRVVRIDAYAITITKSPVYSWQEVQGPLMELLRGVHQAAYLEEPDTSLIQGGGADGKVS